MGQDNASETDAVILGVPFEGVTTKDPLTFYPPGTAPTPTSCDLYCRSGADRAPTYSSSFSQSGVTSAMSQLPKGVASQLPTAAE